MVEEEYSETPPKYKKTNKKEKKIRRTPYRENFYIEFVIENAFPTDYDD